MNTLIQDSRYGIRMLAKSPGFTAIAVLTLALGIGANTAIFSVVNTVLLRPLPYPHADRLVFISEWSQQVPGMSISMADFNDWRAMQTVFSSIVAYQPDNVTLTGEGEPDRLQMRRITAGFFPTMEVEPILGRPLTADDDKVGAAPVVLLSDSFWARKFGSDPNVLGKQLTLDGESYTVIGVLPSSKFHESWRAFDVFSSLWRLENVLGGPSNRGSHPGIYAYARMKPGVTIQQASAEMAGIQRRLAKQYQDDAGESATVQPLLGAVVQDAGLPLYVLMAAVGFVLLIGCVNVANLLMARATERQKEVAVRMALGAGRWRLARQLLTESMLLSLVGGALGLLLAVWATPALARVAVGTIPRVEDVGVDGWVLAFTLGISCFTGLFFGIFPALQASRTDVNSTLKEGSRGSGTGGKQKRLRDALVVVELAISVVLVVGAGLTLKSLYRVLNAEQGFNAPGVMSASFGLPDAKYKTEIERRQFVEQLVAKVNAIPGVEAAGIKNPLLGGMQTGFAVEGQPKPTPGHYPSTEVSRITPGALQAMGATLLRGRFFTAADNKTAGPVCIVDEAMARKYWPGQDPIGKHIGISLGEMKPGETPPWTAVVGVIRTIKNYGADQPVLVETLLPYAQYPGSAGNILMRSTTDPAQLIPTLRATVQSIDPDLPLYDVRRLESVVDANVAPRRLSVSLLGGFAGLALLLAAVGIYGVMAYAVTSRTHEIGIRMALGADPRSVMRLVLSQGARLAVVGVMIGIVAALALTRAMASLLFQVRATDPVTYAGVAILLIVVALAACYIPARRAMRVDPMVALRYE
ncbi:MAG: ABC transporter permease [Candidatus Acidiferrales bacterium]